MSLTVADVLALPGLESMRLRAGEAGLDNPVRWPYVAENSGIAEWVLGSELVFVTGINHPRDEANLLQLLQEACQRKVAGLVILTGPAYIQAIPQRLLDAAHAAGMPLIEQPYSLKMVLVTQAIGSALIQFEQLGRSRHDVLERLLTGDFQSLEVLLHRSRNWVCPSTGIGRWCNCNWRAASRCLPRTIHNRSKRTWLSNTTASVAAYVSGRRGCRYWAGPGIGHCCCRPPTRLRPWLTANNWPPG